MARKDERWRRLQRDRKELEKALKRIPGVEEDLKSIFGKGNPVFPSRSRADINNIVIGGRLQMELESLFDLLEEAKGTYRRVVEAEQDWTVLFSHEDKTMFINGTNETCSIPRAFVDLVTQSESFDGEVSDDGETLTFKHQGKVVAVIPKSLVLFLRREGREALER